MLVLATLCWAVSFPVVKTLMTLSAGFSAQGGTLFATALAAAPRYVLATLLMLAFGGRSIRAFTRGEWVQGGVVGLFSIAGSLLQTDGLQFTSASTSAFLTQLTAILVPAWLALRTRRSPSLLTWACCGLVLVGVAILGHFNWSTMRFGRGELETLACACFYAGQIVWIGKKEFGGNKAGRVTLVMFAVQAVGLSGFAMVTAPSLGALVVPWTSPVWVGLTLVLAVVCSIGAFFLMTRWQPVITPTEAGLVYCAEPIFTSILALFLPGLLSSLALIHYANEKATLALVVGGGLVTVANVLIQLQDEAKV